jgi:rhomboid family protein
VIPIKDNIATDGFPFTTVGLIVVNVVLYVLVCADGGSLVSGPDAHELARFGAIPAALTFKTVFTSMFVQRSLLQLAGNMLFLWLFGNTVEDAMGPVRFLGFYLLAGLAALAVQVVISPEATAATAGASGAIAGVVGGYATLYRRARVLTLVLIVFFFGVIEVPALVMVALWLAMQAAFGNGLDAYLAQLGSFAVGMAAIRLVATRRKPTPPTAAAYR